MDYLLAALITFFALVVGGVVLYALRSGSGGSAAPLGLLQLDPDAVIEMQLDELLAEKNAAAPGGGSFRVITKEKEAYEAMKEAVERDLPSADSTSPSASDAAAAAASPTQAANGNEDSPTSASSGDAASATAAAPSPLSGNKALQSALLKRCIECLTQTLAYDDRVKLVYESYNNMVPRDVMLYLSGVKQSLTDEIESIKREANLLRSGWGEHSARGIFQQAMALSVGLQQRKEARLQAEQQQQQASKDKQAGKDDAAKKEEERKRQQQKEADRAYKELMGQAPPKANGKTSQKKK